MNVYLQCICKTFNIVDRDVSNFAFDVRHEGAMQTCF